MSILHIRIQNNSNFLYKKYGKSEKHISLSPARNLQDFKWPWFSLFFLCTTCSRSRLLLCSDAAFVEWKDICWEILGVRGLEERGDRGVTARHEWCPGSWMNIKQLKENPVGKVRKLNRNKINYQVHSPFPQHFSNPRCQHLETHTQMDLCTCCENITCPGKLLNLMKKLERLERWRSKAVAQFSDANFISNSDVVVFFRVFPVIIFAPASLLILVVI